MRHVEPLAVEDEARRSGILAANVVATERGRESLRIAQEVRPVGIARIEQVAEREAL